MKRLGLAIVLLLFGMYAAAAQFNGCPPGFCNGGRGIGGFGGGFAPGSGAGGGGGSSCASTGIYDLSNVCNDVYFIGALK